MNRIITALAGILSIMSVASANLYGLSTIVTNVDPATDVVTCVDFNGNEWCFTNIDDWSEGDIAALVMYDNCTPEINDDIIITATYCGYAY